MGVTYASPVLAKLAAAGEPGIFLVVRVQDRSAADVVVSHVHEAVTAANATAPPKTVQGGFTTPTPRGVAVHLHAAPMVNAPQRASARDWLTTFTDHLSAAGLSGKVGTSGTWFPDTDQLGLDRTFPAAFVGYRLANYGPWGEPFQGWQVDEKTTQSIAGRIQTHAESITDAKSWAALAGPSVPIPNQDIAKYLIQTGTIVRHQKSVYLMHDHETAFCKYSMSSHGQCVTQAVNPGSDWRQLVKTQTQLLLSAPEAADVGMIKNTWKSPSDWNQSNVRDYHPTVRDPLDYLRNRHLWDEYVIDAAGVNLLTDRHLQHARDLTDWIIEEAASDRFLVSARDLEPWFSGLAAPREVIEKARADFGDMILTWDTILANPGPYTITNPSVVGR